MGTFILLSRQRSNPDASGETRSAASERLIRTLISSCDGVRWKGGYALLGPYDFLDVIDAPDGVAAARVAYLLRKKAGAETEIWAAASRESFEEMIRDLEAVQAGRRDDTTPEEGVDPVDEADRESFPASDPPSYTGTALT